MYIVPSSLWKQFRHIINTYAERFRSVAEIRSNNINKSGALSLDCEDTLNNFCVTNLNAQKKQENVYH